jgi:uncharacterized protein (TIGR03083 family)
MSASDEEFRTLLRASCTALAAALGNIPESRWSEPSMCEGWSVATVVAHLTMPSRYDEAAYRAELAVDGFDFSAMSDRVALRDGALPVAALLADLRSDTMATFAMPGGGLAGSLSHVVIHGLDATWPLGLDRTCPDDAASVVLDGLVAGSPNVFGIEVDDLSLRANDLGWVHGEGRRVEKPAAELVLALSGRRVSL